MSRISIVGLRALGTHGVLDEEQQRPQPFVIDVELEVDVATASESDDLADTVDYGTIAAAAHRVVAQERHKLIERVAGRVADDVLSSDSRIDAVTVRVHKPQAPLGLDAADVIVELRRERGAPG